MEGIMTKEREVTIFNIDENVDVLEIKKLGFESVR